MYYTKNRSVEQFLTVSEHGVLAALNLSYCNFWNDIYALEK